ncbi:hypothetical protein GYMLUDRAFT_306896 [Collybiopsis luxurians FD-317 M1]|nr:hypothetical protein GYMLUDRAFT_306896 [Collybiopsis luxurians FD-317 M1]
MVQHLLVTKVPPYSFLRPQASVAGFFLLDSYEPVPRFLFGSLTHHACFTRSLIQLYNDVLFIAASSISSFPYVANGIVYLVPS